MRSRLGDAAHARAREFTWDRTAEENLQVLDAEAATERAGLRTALSGSETLKAAGLAAATLASNAIALLFTVLFARLLGADGYGSLAALISTFLILAVPGSALQVMVARETATGALGSGERLASTLAAWRRMLLVVLVVVTVASVLLRTEIAALLSVEQEWAAAATLPTGCLWLLLSIERGALQGVHAYREVGWSIVLEAGGRLVTGVILVAAGLGVTGAYLGTPASMAITAVVLAQVSHRKIGVAHDAHAAARLRGLIAGAWPAVIGLFLVAVLQNVDVILVKRTIGGDEAGAYAAAAVAAKAVVWVAIGVGLYLLPEATRKARAGEDPRPVLMRALAVVAAVAIPMLHRLRGRARDGAAAGVRRGDGPGGRRVAGAGDRDDAACRGLPVRAVHARAARGPVPDRARRGRGGRGRAAVGLGAEQHRRVRDGRARAAGRRRSGRARARPRAPPGAGRERERATRGLADRRAVGAAASACCGRPLARSWRSDRSAGAPQSCWLLRAATWLPSIRTRAPTVGRRRSAPTRGVARPTMRRSTRTLRRRGSRIGCATCARPSADAHDEVAGQIALLYVDGAHRFGPAREDIARWGARVRPGGRCSSTTRSPRWV